MREASLAEMTKKIVKVDQKIAEMDQKVGLLHIAIVQKEQTIFAMWSVVNTLLRVLNNKNVYTKEEFQEIANLISKERQTVIDEVVAKARESTSPEEAKPAEILDDLSKHIDLTGVKEQLIDPTSNCN